MMCTLSRVENPVSGRSRSRGETIGRGNQDVGHAARVMPGAPDEMKLSIRPHLRDLPWNVRRSADVEPPVDEHAGNARQLARIAQQNSVLEPGRVSPVVRDQSGKD